MARLGFYFDASKCTGCRTCQIACKDRYDWPVRTNFRTVRTYEAGVYPHAQMYHYSHACNHCEKPACVANCPSGAMQVSADDGTVQHDDTLCIGCSTCTQECPYSIPVQVPHADGGTVSGKCDACKPFRDAGMNPVCVDACNMRCLDFGDLDELKEKYGTDLVQDIPVLPSSETTNPSILIQTKPCVVQDDFAEHAI